MVDLIATTALTYGTRRLLPDDTFNARTRADARALVAIGKAKFPASDEKPVVKPKPATKRKAKSKPA
jgi:hypothetical protein